MNSYLQLTDTYPFQLQPLPYDYNAMEPYIDTETMMLHHDHHLAGFVNTLNSILSDYPELQSWTLESLIKYSELLPPDVQEAIYNNASGIFNHDFYFQELASSALTPNTPLYNEIIDNFGDYDTFKTAFGGTANGVFGSGYAWLVRDNDEHLKIITTVNQDTPLPLGYEPVLNIDAWEHAYYLKHHNYVQNYTTDWFNILERPYLPS